MTYPQPRFVEVDSRHPDGTPRRSFTLAEWFWRLRYHEGEKVVPIGNRSDIEFVECWDADCPQYLGADSPASRNSYHYHRREVAA